MRRDIWNLLGKMSDFEFESEIEQVRAARAAAAEATAYERAMIKALGGIYLRHVELSQESEREKLVRAYTSAGLSDEQIGRLVPKQLF